ncbi:MAG TPA: hypothetical protein PKA88_26990, partial [Polyangiaceae bacterium]|nr:hypothetical protein [Polyangiaceae bacterium]
MNVIGKLSHGAGVYTAKAAEQGPVVRTQMATNPAMVRQQTDAGGFVDRFQRPLAWTRNPQRPVPPSASR